MASSCAGSGCCPQEGVATGAGCRRPDEAPASRFLESVYCQPATASREFAFAFQRQQQCAQSSEAVGAHQSGGDEFAEGCLGLRLQQACAILHLVEERRPVSVQMVGQRLRGGRQRRSLALRRGQCAPHCGILPAQQGDWRSAHRPRRRIARRVEAGPECTPGKAQAVQPGRIVIAHARGQHIGFPRNRGDFVTLELFDDRRETGHAFRSGCCGNALPVEQEAHEVG